MLPGGTPPDRLYGRQRGHRLRPRQQTLLDITLPRLRLTGPPPTDLPIWLEVGFGGGEHCLAQIAAHPRIRLIACEVFANGICSLLSRLVAEGEEATGVLPPHLHIWDDDARRLLRLLPEASLDRLFLLFPDPWPKSRHAKRRFVHPANLPMVARVLKPGAEWRIASDDPTYQHWVQEVMQEQDFFAPAQSVVDRPAGWPPTRYEAKAITAGRQPRYWTFVRGQQVSLPK
jgi:tRNA (guanine-N7-)-methyltransferase